MDGRLVMPAGMHSVTASKQATSWLCRARMFAAGTALGCSSNQRKPRAYRSRRHMRETALWTLRKRSRIAFMTWQDTAHSPRIKRRATPCPARGTTFLG